METDTLPGGTGTGESLPLDEVDIPKEEEVKEEETPEEQPEGEPEQPEGEKTEDDIEKLNLQEPKHLATFKASYRGYKEKTVELETRNQELETELDTLRANQGKGVYLDANVPLEDFNPTEALNRLKTEEPDYYERVQQHFVNNEFWPSVPTQFQNILDQDVNSVPDAIGDQIATVWDTMVQKFAGVPGDTMFDIIRVLRDSPDLVTVIRERASGASQYDPNTPFTPGGIQAVPKVQTVKEVADELGLDPSEERDLKTINKIRGEQEQALKSYQRAKDVQEASRREQEKLRKDHEKAQKDTQKTIAISDEEITKRADTMLANQIETALVNDVKSLYGSAIPKGKESLIDTIVAAAKERLRKDPNYQNARQTAHKWFKQSATAKTEDRQNTYRDKGIAALAVMVPLRANAIKAVAVDLIAPVKEKAKKPAAPVAKPAPREIVSTGSVVPPKAEAKPAAVNDIEAARKNIRARLANDPAYTKMFGK